MSGCQCKTEHLLLIESEKLQYGYIRVQNMEKRISHSQWLKFEYSCLTLSMKYYTLELTFASSDPRPLKLQICWLLQCKMKDTKAKTQAKQIPTYQLFHYMKWRLVCVEPCNSRTKMKFHLVPRIHYPVKQFSKSWVPFIEPWGVTPKWTNTRQWAQ